MSKFLTPREKRDLYEKLLSQNTEQSTEQSIESIFAYINKLEEIIKEYELNFSLLAKVVERRNKE